MDRQQSLFSAEFDPLMDILESWLATEGLQHTNGDGRVKVTGKQLHSELLPLAKNINMKSFPVSIAGFSRWIHGRSEVLKETFAYERELDTKTNTHLYCFGAPQQETF